MAKSRIHPQFIHTLVPGFHTQLTIPEDFFSKYVEGRSVAELKSDVSDKTWKVNLTGRRLTGGWEEFAVANDFQIGDVVVVRYLGDLVFHVSDLGPNYSEIQDNEGKTLLKKRLHPRTQVEFSENDGDVVDDVDDDEDNIEIQRENKAKNIQEAEAVSSSSSSDNSCFVALVTALNLRSDTLYLPLHFTSANVLTRKCREIVLTDGGERSWTLDLRFNESSDTCYISRGWRHFCEENGQKAGGSFMFQLVGKGETPVLSFSPAESIRDRRRQRDYSESIKRESVATKLSSSEEENIEGKGSKEECSSLESLTEKKKYAPKRKLSPYSSYSPCHKRFVTFTLPPDYLRLEKLCLPRPFLRANGINKPGEMYLLGRDGTKWLTKLILDNKGTMKMRKGWKDFVKENDLKSSFTLKLIWVDTTPVLSLCGAESTSDSEQEEVSKAIKSNNENNKEENQKQFVTLTITPYGVKKCRLVLSAQFVRVNNINKPGTIYLLDTDGTKWLTNLQRDNKGTMSLGKGWKEFAEANDIKIGESFTMGLIWEDTTPMLSLISTKSSSSKANEKESISSEHKSRLVTLTLTHEDVKASKLQLPSQFMKANSINKLGKITLLSENGMEWSAYLLSRDGTIALGNGWKGFCETNGVKLGQSFTLEVVYEQDSTPVLKFCSLEAKYKKC